MFGQPHAQHESHGQCARASLHEALVLFSTTAALCETGVRMTIQFLNAKGTRTLHTVGS